MKRIYLDNAASTRVDDRVIEAMIPYFKDYYAVASSIFSHEDGLVVQDALESSRNVMKDKLNAKDGKLIFTSDTTESNNLALKGVAYSYKSGKIIISAIEDISIYNTVKYLEKDGYEIKIIPVSKDGIVNLNALSEAIDKKTVLVSIQHVNQETGVVQDIKSIGDICREKGVLYHCDSSFGFPLFNIDLNKFNIDILTLSSHMWHGPKGVSALYIKNNVSIKPIITGGYQEFNIRAGVQNVPAIVGMVKAYDVFDKTTFDYLLSLKTYFIERLKEIDHTKINGSLEKSHPGIINVTFMFIEGESITLRLNLKNISVITGSACFSKSLEASHVLLAMGLTHELAHGSIRFSFSKYNTKNEIDNVIESLKSDVDFLRKMSPIYKEEA